MRLADFLIAQRISPSDFARQIGVGRMTVHRYLRGTRFPRPHILKRIHRVTDGTVSANDFLELDDDPDQPSNLAMDPDSDEAIVGRTLYPWSRLSAADHHRLDEAFDTLMDEPLEGTGLSPVLQIAVDGLGDRVRVVGDAFELDGKPVGAVQIVKAANELRRSDGLPSLVYPGVT